MGCLNFINETACYWTFSTLSQVFGAILGLLSIFVIFAIKKFREEGESLGKQIDYWEKQPEPIVDTAGIKHTREEMVKPYYNMRKSLEATKIEFIKRFIFTITLIACVIGYSIASLPFSFLFAKHIIFFLFSSVVIPILVLFITICFISISFIYESPPRMFRMDKKPMFKWWEFWKCGYKHYKQVF